MYIPMSKVKTVQKNKVQQIDLVNKGNKKNIFTSQEKKNRKLTKTQTGKQN